MKSIAKTIFFMFLLIVIVNIFIEFFLLNTTKARVYGMTGSALETAVYMAPKDIEDGDEGVSMETSGKTSVYVNGILDTYTLLLEGYFSQMGDSITFTKTGADHFRSTYYQQSLTYVKAGTINSDTQFKNIKIYINIDQMPDGHFLIETALFSEVYFNSKFTRMALVDDLLAGEIEFYDSIIYRLNNAIE